MNDAVVRGYRVGVSYLNQHEINWYNKELYPSYKNWIENQDTFGETSKHRAIRYIIAN